MVVSGLFLGKGPGGLLDVLVDGEDVRVGGGYRESVVFVMARD